LLAPWAMNDSREELGDRLSGLCQVVGVDFDTTRIGGEIHARPNVERFLRHVERHNLFCFKPFPGERRLNSGNGRIIRLQKDLEPFLLGFVEVFADSEAFAELAEKVGQVFHITRGLNGGFTEEEMAAADGELIPFQRGGVGQNVIGPSAGIRHSYFVGDHQVELGENPFCPQLFVREAL